MTRSQVQRKWPSRPPTPIALTSMRVRRKGTVSGNLSRCIATSKQSPKSMCRILPENWRAGIGRGEACGLRGVGRASLELVGRSREVAPARASGWTCGGRPAPAHSPPGIDGADSGSGRAEACEGSARARVVASPSTRSPPYSSPPASACSWCGGRASARRRRSAARAPEGGEGRGVRVGLRARVEAQVLRTRL